MGKSHTKASNDVYDRAKKLIAKYHPELRDAGLRIDFIFVSTDSEEGSALMHQGYAAAAVISIVGPKERALGMADVKCLIDEERYTEMSPEERDALLDHEIYHVVLKRDKLTRVKLDEHGRPKVGMRKHDVQIGHFSAIAERHGEASGEVQQMRHIFKNHRQTLFGFVENIKVHALPV